MFKYSVFLAAALAAGLLIMPAAAQNPEQESASGGDGFSLQDWTEDSPVDTAPWLDEFLPEEASEGIDLFADLNEAQASNTLTGALDKDPFFLDGRFYSGRMYLDRFGANHSDTTDKWAEKSLRLSNGDVVTVALVPKLGATSSPPYGTGYNIGMVRYNSAGVKQKWNNAAGAFTDSTKSYYVFPNKDVYDSNGSFQGIHAAKEHDGWIYILAQRFRSAADKTGDMRVVRFQLSTSRWKWTNVLPSANVVESGIGMHFYTDGGFDRLTVGISRKVAPSKFETWLAGYLLGDLAALSIDSSFGNNGSVNVTPANCDSCRATALAASQVIVGGTYVAGNYDYSSTDQDGYITRFNKKGASDASFGFNGRANVWFPIVVSDQKDDLKDIVVQKNLVSPELESIYVVAEVENVCDTTSVGVAKYGSNGFADESFGPAGGQMMFGGGAGPLCITPSSIKSRAMALSGSRLAIVGYSTTTMHAIPGPYLSVGGPAFSVVDADTGQLKDTRRFRPEGTGVDIGVNGGNGASTFLSVVSDETDSFYAVGTAKDTAHNQKHIPMTARVRADRIFGNGME